MDNSSGKLNQSKLPGANKFIAFWHTLPAMDSFERAKFKS